MTIDKSAYRIVAWKDGDWTDYVVLHRDYGNTIRLSANFGSRGLAEDHVKCASANDALLNADGWQQGRMLPSRFREVVLDLFGLDIRENREYDPYVEDDETHTMTVSVGDGLYLTWQWYHGLVETAYIS